VEESGETRPDTGTERPSATETLRTAVGDDASWVQQGRKLDSPIGPLPIRSLAGIAAFLVAFMAVYLLAWAALGGAGLIFGWIPAAVVGVLALRAAAERVRPY
jgi:hypothetical protein